MTRDQFIERKTASDIRKKELSSALAECEAQNLAESVVDFHHLVVEHAGRTKTAATIIL